MRQRVMIAAALVNPGKNGGCYDAFRNRVIFPIIDLRGGVIAFGGRNLGEKGPKYLNSGDTPVFKKSRNLFALNFAKNTKRPELILCEGYMDVVSVHQGGFDNAVATLGTALTPEQAKEAALDMARELAAEGIVLASDGFFPFDDCVTLAAEYGVTAIVQPGGSVRDEDSIRKADELGIAMSFTGERHFKH